MHISRHSFAHIAQESGAESSAIKNILGHSNLATTERYMGSFDTSKTDETLRNVFQETVLGYRNEGIRSDKRGAGNRIAKGYDPGANNGCDFGNQQIILFASWQIAHVELWLGARFRRKFDQPTNNQ